MAERKPEWPEVGGLVFSTIENDADYGSYDNLCEFGKRGFLYVRVPRYCIEVAVNSWKRAEELLPKFSQIVITNVGKAGGLGSFRREK